METLGHEISLMQLMQEDIPSLAQGEIIIDPYFRRGYERIAVMVTSLCEIQKEMVTDKLPIDNPDFNFFTIFL